MDEQQGRGRPTKLTPELQDFLCSKIRKSLPVSTACDLAELHSTTFLDWMNRGEQGESPYEDFSRAVKKARAEAKEFWIDVLNNATVDKTINPAPAYFVLERSDSANWGRKSEVKLGIEQDKKLSAKELARLAREQVETRRALARTASEGGKIIHVELTPPDQTGQQGGQ